MSIVYDETDYVLHIRNQYSLDQMRLIIINAALKGMAIGLQITQGNPATALDSRIQFYPYNRRALDNLHEFYIARVEFGYAATLYAKYGMKPAEISAREISAGEALHYLEETWENRFGIRMWGKAIEWMKNL